MKRSITGIAVLALAAALSTGLASYANSAPPIMSMKPASNSVVIHVDDSSQSLSREGARIIRRDRHRKHRIERHERRHERGQKSAQHRLKHHRLAHRRNNNDRYAYNQRPDRQYLYQFDGSADKFRDGRHVRRFGDAYDGDHRYHYHGRPTKPRIYRMESFGYSAKPQMPLKDILTATPD